MIVILTVYSRMTHLLVEQPKVRLEILAWWKIERLIEDENCNIDMNFTVAYFDERVKAMNNQLLKFKIQIQLLYFTVNERQPLC